MGFYDRELLPDGTYVVEIAPYKDYNRYGKIRTSIINGIECKVVRVIINDVRFLKYFPVGQDAYIPPYGKAIMVKHKYGIKFY